MRNTFLAEGRAGYGGGRAPAVQTSTTTSVPAPIGGWDAYSPLANMPPANAVELTNWFPQPGYVELRRGHVYHCDTGTSAPVETIMAYQAADTTVNGMLAASNLTMFDVTTSTPATVGTGFTNDRWQHVNFITSGGSYLWMCNGDDTPQYWDGSTLTATAITGVTAEDMIHCAIYRSRIWAVMKDSTIAAYLAVDSIQGAATEFDVGTYFRAGGYLQAIGSWSTDTNDGPNEFIAFFSQYGDVAIFQIEDPSDPTKVNYLGTSQIGTPIGRRCLSKIGSDLGAITIDGVLPLSQVLTYDRAALIGASITKNIRQAMTDAAQNYSDEFGWQLISYPRNTMAILNVPILEGSQQEQFVMNTLTGGWANFVGQNANCWEVFEDRAYFGGNDGIVRLADEAGGDEDQTLSADMRCAFNYYTRGRQKQWMMVRPSITINAAFPVQPYIGLNVDFQTNAETNPIEFGAGIELPLWNDPLNAIWNSSMWPGDIEESNWTAIGGLGYCSSIRMTVDIPWSEAVRIPLALKINSFDMIYSTGSLI